MDDGGVVHRLTDTDTPSRPAEPDRPTLPDRERQATPKRSAIEGAFAVDTAGDAERRRGLRRMKAVALGFLIGATVVFIASRWAEAQGAGEWVGYVAAAAEAGMVGALADWFAVTALFRHPLGIPIPHTAIIKRKKDQVGAGLGTFFRQNFLSPDVVESKVRDAEIAGRAGKWLADSGHAARVASEASTVLRVLVEMLRDDDVQQVLDRMIIKRVAEPQWGPPVGRVLATLLQEGRQEALIQLLADRAFQWALNAGPIIERVVERDSPAWSPRWADHFIGDRIHRELMDFTDKVRRNTDHELRRSATRFLFEFADDLQNDNATIARAESVKEQIMAREEVARAAETAWRTAKRLILESVDDPSSGLRTRIAEAVAHIGESLRDDPDLRDKVDNWIVRGARHLVAEYGVEITAIITDTIEKWNVDEASQRIELHVGRDLQFIRINGTVVGSLAGLTIYTVAQLLF